MDEESSGRSSLADRLGMAAGRIRVASTPFVRQPIDLTILPASGTGPHPIVVALHGMGMRPEPFARWFRSLYDGPWAWIVPEGTYPMERRHGDLRSIGYAWYVHAGDTPAFRETLRESEQRILRLLPDRASAWNLDATRTVLLGFSQGAYFAAALGLRHEDRFRGVVIAGGRARPGWADRPQGRTADLPFLFIHGRDDEVVPIDQARASAEEIRQMGFPVQFVETGGDHIWNEEMSDGLRRWLREVLDES